MACVCIGGICIPYTALLPMLLLGLRWIASQFAKVGLLPDSIARRLGAFATNATTKRCCGDGDGGTGGDVASSSSSSSDDGRGAGGREGGGGVVHVDDLSTWEAIFASHSNHPPKSTSSSSSTSSSLTSSTSSNSLFVKFTADWCKPCKSIEPTYASLSHSRHAPSRRFVSIDVDGNGCDVVSGRYRIGMLPTFVYFANGIEGGRMSGGHDGERLIDWVDEMLMLASSSLPAKE